VKPGIKADRMTPKLFEGAIDHVQAKLKERLLWGTKEAFAPGQKKNTRRDGWG